MKMRKIALALLVCAALPSMVVATKPVKQGKLTVEQSMGYIVVRIDEFTDVKYVNLLRIDGASGLPVWKYGDKLPGSSKMLDAAEIWKGQSWGKSEGAGFYVIRVNPGQWIIGGAGDAAVDTSLSLGTYGFDIKPGKLTYIGTLSAAAENGKARNPVLAKTRVSDDIVKFGTLMNVVMSFNVAYRPPNASDPIPADLKTDNLVLAEPVEDIRFNNVFRGMVTRSASLPPITSVK